MYKCHLCSNELIDQFTKDGLAESYCLKCDLHIMENKTFKDFMIIYINKNIKNKQYKKIILNKLNNELFNFKNIGLSVHLQACNTNICHGKIDTCFIYQYNYYGLKFYRCLFKGIILFTTLDLNNFLKQIKKSVRKDYYKNIINKILNIFKKKE